jgi:hypothetical protein
MKFGYHHCSQRQAPVAVPELVMQIDSKARSAMLGLTAVELLVFVVNVVFAAWFTIFVDRCCAGHIHGGWRIVTGLTSFVIGFGLAAVLWYGLLHAMRLALRRRHTGHDDSTKNA